MTLFTQIGNFLKSEEAILAAELHPVLLRLKADLAPVGKTLIGFLEQDGAALLTGAAAAIAVPGASPMVAIVATAEAVLAMAEKQGVTLAASSAMAIAANLHAQATAPAANTAPVN